jgi:hypothetical protein
LLVGDTANTTGSPTFYVKPKSGLMAQMGFNFSSTATSANPDNNLLSTGSYFNGSATFATQTTACIYQQASGIHYWYTNTGLTPGSSFTTTERMRLDSSGNLLVGATSATYKSQFALDNTTGNGNPALFLTNADTTNPRGLFYFASGSASGDFAFLYQGAGTNRFYVNGAGNVYGTGAYNAISDASLKTNIRSLELGLSEILALQPRRFDWIDGSKENAIGFIAQEVEAVTSDLIVGWSRSVESIETLKAVSVTDIIPILVKSIQEQQALITQLTARITALEGA